MAARDRAYRVLAETRKEPAFQPPPISGSQRARGEWIGLLDHDDLLEPDALFEIVKYLQDHPEADLIYSDEDKLTEEGFDAPIFKPDWSPDFFLSYNYLCHFTTVRRELVRGGRADSARSLMARRTTIFFSASSS